jgi:DNA-binding transcriptional MocR family regulator
MSDTSAADRWQDDRTTFQRVYDVLVGTQLFLTARDFAEHADCSETAARDALEQLAEMGIAERRDGRPVTYRRNNSYFRWKRIESLVREHSPNELQERLDDLIAEDEAFQDEYGVPDPDAVPTATLSADNHNAVQRRWKALSEWRTIRRDIRLLQRAIERVHSRTDEGVHA